MHFVANGQNFGRVTNTAPGQIGNVQQAINAAEVDECAVVGDVLDDTLDDAAFLEVGQQCIALFTNTGFKHGTTGNDHVVTLAIELDDLEFVGLAFVRRGVLDRTHVDQRTRQEGADAVGHNGQTTLHLAGDGAGHEGAFVQGLLEVVPCSDALGAIAREAGFTETVLDLLNGDLNEVADSGFEFALVVQEFFTVDVAFGLQSGIYNDEILVDTHNFCGNDFALAHFLAREAFFEKIGKTFLTDWIG